MKAIDLLNELQDLQKENPAIFDKLQLEIYHEDNVQIYDIKNIVIEKLYNKLLINLE